MEAANAEGGKKERYYSLCLVYRKPHTLFFSIEKVFGQLVPRWEKHIRVRSVHAGQYSSSVPAIVKNIRDLRKEKADIFHITGDIHYAVLAFPKRKTILTIHDCVFLHKYKGIRKLVITWLFLKWPVRRCRYITTISEKSREEIIRHTGCNPGKVVVIPNPVPDTIYYSEKPFNNDKPTLLFIGSTPNKNLPRAIEALKGLNCRLCIIGVVPEPVLQKLNEYEMDYTTMSGLTDAELADQYSAADIILYPSLYEGFGLPIIEGQQAGRPVITSNISPMNDVAGEGACLVDPYDIGSIREGISRVIQNKAYRDSLVNKGFENIKRFSADHLVSQYLKLYDAICRP